jgi:hypothetical protein
MNRGMNGGMIGGMSGWMSRGMKRWIEGYNTVLYHMSAHHCTPHCNLHYSLLLYSTLCPIASAHHYIHHCTRHCTHHHYQGSRVTSEPHIGTVHLDTLRPYFKPHPEHAQDCDTYSDEYREEYEAKAMCACLSARNELKWHVPLAQKRSSRKGKDCKDSKHVKTCSFISI